MHELTEAMSDYFAKSMGASGSDGPDPRLLAGMVVGVEMAVIELWGRTQLALPEILEAAEEAIPDLAEATRSIGASRAGVDRCRRRTLLPTVPEQV